MLLIFKFGWVLIVLELLYALYWTSTMFYILGEGNASPEQRTFDAFLIVHTVVIPLTIYLTIRSRFMPPELFILFPFTLELFYDLYGLLITIRYLDKSFQITYNLQFAGMIWAFCMSILVFLWYLIVLLSGARERVKKNTNKMFI